MPPIPEPQDFRVRPFDSFYEDFETTALYQKGREIADEYQAEYEAQLKEDCQMVEGYEWVEGEGCRPQDRGLNGNSDNSSFNNGTSQTCSENRDGQCPSGCGPFQDADCCELDITKEWVNGSCQEKVRETSDPNVDCSVTEDGLCPKWCASGSDYDCCVVDGSKEWIQGRGCYDI